MALLLTKKMRTQKSHRLPLLGKQLLTADTDGTSFCDILWVEVGPKQKIWSKPACESGLRFTNDPLNKNYHKSSGIRSSSSTSSPPPNLFFLTVQQYFDDVYGQTFQNLSSCISSEHLFNSSRNDLDVSKSLICFFLELFFSINSLMDLFLSRGFCLTA